MIIRSGSRIRLLKERVEVNGAVDRTVRCSEINLGSYCGLTEATIELPGVLYGKLAKKYNEAHVRVSSNGSGRTHFSGYMSLKSQILDPSADGNVRLRAFTRTKWLNKTYVGQAAGLWEVRYWVRDPRTRALTGWNPANILTDIFEQLPAEDRARIGLGDIRCLQDVADITTPDITFRLTTVLDAINQIAGLVGDVAFRERFQGDKVYLDFYRMREGVRTQSAVECASWGKLSTTKANIQAISDTDDATELTTRVRGFGAYRQFMITCRNAVEGLEAISETEPLRQLKPDWDTSLEALVLKCPDLATGDGETYSAEVLEAAAADVLTVKCKVELETIPVGATMKVKSSGEIVGVTAFTPAVAADPEADPPIEAQAAIVTITRAQKGTLPAAIKTGDTLDITVPGIRYVFRRFRLPAILDGYNIMRQGCLLDNTLEPYPQHQAFVYGAIQVQKQDPPGEGGAEGQKYVQGVIPGLLGASLVDQVRLDVERRRVTFGRPVLTLLESRPKTSGTEGEKDVTYQRTVCGLTFTVENRDYPFAYDTGTVDGVVDFDFAEDEGLLTQWQSNAYHFWCIGTAGLPIRGVEFPCLRFPLKTTVDPESGVPTESELNPEWAEAGSGIVVRNDLVQIKTQCEQILRERCRRARSFQITVPWFDDGYKVGQGIKILGVEVPRDKYKITNVAYSFSPDGHHSTSLIVDNNKPPVRNRAKVRL